VSMDAGPVGQLLLRKAPLNAQIADAEPVKPDETLRVRI